MNDAHSGHGTAAPHGLGASVRQAVLGRARDLRDPSIRHKLSLTAFLAWVGLGADGLSSSAYGPEEAYRALEGHTYLALSLVAATAVTVYVLCHTYSKIIEKFPQGGGGYVVATELLGQYPGVVSGCALLVDYVLTITVSIAGGGDAIFSLVPEPWHYLKIPVEYTAIVLLIVLNLRGVKESVAPLVPVFIAFIVTHALLILGAIGAHLMDFPAVARHIQSGYGEGSAQIGAFGLFLVFLRAYSLGGGTYTGIEAVSNAVGALREPRVETGKRTMLFMGLSLALTAGGLLLCYMLVGVQPVKGRTLNAVLADNLAGGISLGGLPVGAWFATLTISTEAILLLVAAQTGFIDGPRVMANMAADSWLPRRFTSISDRLTMQNGILLIGVAAMGLLAYTRGKIQLLVIMYSINVFVTFTLSQLGMMRLWRRERGTNPLWKRSFGLHVVGFVLCASILVVMVVEKMTHGAWVTVLLTAACIGVCVLIRNHYRAVVAQLREIGKMFADLPITTERKPMSMAEGKGRNAVLLVGGYEGGLGIHLLLNVLRLFPNTFRSLTFVSVGVVDSGFLRHGEEVHELEARTRANLDKYVELGRKLGFESNYAVAIGTDAVAEVSDLCVAVARERSHSIFFAGELLFEKPVWWHRFLHNETAYAIQRQIRFHGLYMVIMPLLLRSGRAKQKHPHPAKP